MKKIRAYNEYEVFAQEVIVIKARKFKSQIEKIFYYLGFKKAG
jgi:hypothetical protein